MFSLAVRYLRMQKRRAFLTVFSMILAIFLVAASGIAISSLQALMVKTEVARNGSWHYKIYGAGDDTLNVTSDEIEALRNSSGVSSVGLCDESDYLEVQEGSQQFYELMTYDKASIAMMPYEMRLASGRMPQNENELIISSGSASFWGSLVPQGSTVTFQQSDRDDMTFDQPYSGSVVTVTIAKSEPRTYTIVGVFERFRTSNMPNVSEAVTVDNSIQAPDVVMLQMSDAADFEKSMQGALDSSGLNGTVSLEKHFSLFRWIGKGNGTLQYLPAVVFLMLAGVILLVMMMVIRNFYTMSVQEKTDAYGILRCMNATSRQIRAMVLWEGVLTWAIALPFGYLFALVFMQGMLLAVEGLHISVLDGLQLTVPAWPLLASAAASFIAMLLSILGAGKKACRITPVEAFRGNADNTSASEHPLYETEVAKNRSLSLNALLYRRYRQKAPSRYRATLLTIAVSVALSVYFAGGAGAARDYVDDYTNAGGMDFFFNANHHVIADSDQYAALREDLSQYDGIVAMQEVYPIEYILNVPEDKIAAGYEETWWEYYEIDTPFVKSDLYAPVGQNVKTIEIIPVSRENYDSLEFNGNAPTYDELLENGSVILCQSEVLRKNGIMDVLDFASFAAGDSLTLAQVGGGTISEPITLSVSGVVSQTPWFAPERAHGFVMVPIETIDSYYVLPVDHSNQYGGGILSIDAEDEARETLQKTFAERDLTPFGALAGFSFVSPYMRNLEVEKACSLINLFAYGFLAIIVIICSLNIFNSIWADLDARKRDVAILRSMGMSRRQVSRYLYGESLRYALVGMLIGDIAGFSLFLLAASIVGRTASITVGSMAGIFGLTLLVTLIIALCAGIMPIRRLEKATIVEELRAVN